MKIIISLLCVLFSTNAFAQKDTAFANVFIESNKTDSVLIKVDFISKYKSPISVFSTNTYFDLICDFGSIKLEIQKLIGKCFETQEPDCDPAPETFDPREKKVIRYNDTNTNKYDISDLFDKLKGKYMGVYRIKIYYHYFYLNSIYTVSSDWVYLNW